MKKIIAYNDWNELPLFLSKEHVAVILNCHPETVKKKCASGVLPAVKNPVTGEWIIPRDALRRALAAASNDMAKQFSEVSA